MIVTASRNHSLSLFTIQNAYSNFILDTVLSTCW